MRDREKRPRRRSTAEVPERLPWLRYDRMARAVTERLRVRAVPGQPFWSLAVRNPVHHTHYQVLLPEYPSGEAQFCSCPDFARRGIGTCKHVEAATAWLSSHPELTRPPGARRSVAGVWRAVDRALKEARVSHRPEAVRWRQPGRVLFEKRGARGPDSSKKREGGKGSVQPVGGSGA
ncbi:MAG: SWIM zinc finger domain-containing protein [Thermoplasmata archaeon]|nr:SWIM zinc finger domain-containing protein [Thermoplasmata archaeon]